MDGAVFKKSSSEMSGSVSGVVSGFVNILVGSWME
jgi:hypothetical protein